jgi:hypothetical protein
MKVRPMEKLFLEKSHALPQGHISHATIPQQQMVMP